VNCGNDPFRIVKEAAGIGKFGLQIVCLAERLGTKIFGIGTDSFCLEDNEVEDQALQNRFGADDTEAEEGNCMNPLST